MTKIYRPPVQLRKSAKVKGDGLYFQGNVCPFKKGFSLPSSSRTQTNKTGGSSGKPLTYFPFVESSSNFRFFSHCPKKLQY